MLASARFRRPQKVKVLFMTFMTRPVSRTFVLIQQHLTKGTIIMPHTKHAKSDTAHKTDKQLFVEKRPEGDFAVRKANSERASDVLPTQEKAIARAKELSPGAAPLVERVRKTESGKPNQWRKA
jgi:hypothetical protein